MYTAAVADLGKIVQEKKVPIGGGDTTASFFFLQLSCST